MRSSLLLLLSVLWIIATSRPIERTERKHLGTYSTLQTKSLAKLRKGQRNGSIGHTARVPSGGGMTYDACHQSVDCKGERECREYVPYGRDDLCDGEAECRCRPQRFKDCERSADCEAGEICAQGTYSHFCLSESYADDADKPPRYRRGFTMDKCSSSDECQRPRSCRFLANGNSQDCAGRDGCLCLPRQLQTCSAHRECPFREVCATGRDGEESLCVSEAHVSNSSDLMPLPRLLTYDPCATGKDCEKPRTCKIFDNENKLRFCMARLECFCIAENLSSCTRSGDCVDGEVCVQGMERRESDMFCVSQRYASGNEDLTVVDGGTDSSTTSPTSPTTPMTPTTSTSSQEQSVENEICIDAKALHAIDKQSLLYQTHRLATTLCDQFQSCATPGHIVLFRGKAMMMRSYCKITSCKEQVMMVNSPKYQRGLLVPSKTSELHYTPFAARYGTSAEELFLTTLIRLGI